MTTHKTHTPDKHKHETKHEPAMKAEPKMTPSQPPNTNPTSPPKPTVFKHKDHVKFPEQNGHPAGTGIVSSVNDDGTYKVQVDGTNVVLSEDFKAGELELV